MGLPSTRARSLLAVLPIAAAAVLATASSGAADAPHCTHGVSSIGPVEIVDGKVVSGSLTPHTEACLP